MFRYYWKDMLKYYLYLLKPLLLMIVATILRILLIYLLWNWFLVPLGVQKITFWHAGGLMLFLIIFKNSSIKKTDDEDQLKEALSANLLMLFNLALAFIFKSLM